MLWPNHAGLPPCIALAMRPATVTEPWKMAIEGPTVGVWPSVRTLNRHRRPWMACLVTAQCSMPTCKRSMGPDEVGRPRHVRYGHRACHTEAWRLLQNANSLTANAAPQRVCCVASSTRPLSVPATLPFLRVIASEVLAALSGRKETAV